MGSARKQLLWLCLALLLALSVSAINFDVTIEPESRTIIVGQKAEFNLTVSHDANTKQFFEIYSSEVQWDLSTIPSRDRILEVPAKGTKSTKLLLRPLYLASGAFLVDVTVKLSGTNQYFRKNVQIGIAREKDEYSPSVFTKVDIPKKIDPREEITIKVTLDNQNRLWIPKLDVKIRSELINKDYTTSLKPLEKKEIDFKIKLDESTPPQKDSLQITLFAYSRNKTVRFDVPGIPYEVLGFGKVSDKIETTKRFLRTENKITFINTGNGIQKRTFKMPASFFARIFTSSDHPFYSTRTSEGRMIVWEIVLGPKETKVIEVTRNYRPFFLIIILAIIASAAYMVFRTPLIIKKAAMVVETKEGGISELKVIISMVNRTNYPIRDLLVMDKVPKIAEVKSDFELGTLRPTSIVNAGDKGSLLKWKIDALGPKEERILSYKIRTKLSILGGFRLPPTKIKFKFFNYKRSTFSNMESLFGPK